MSEVTITVSKEFLTKTMTTEMVEDAVEKLMDQSHLYNVELKITKCEPVKPIIGFVEGVKANA